MYLISVYFDEETNHKIQHYMNKVAEKSGNTFMTDGKIPPHITISAFESRHEDEILSGLKDKLGTLKGGTLTWCTVGVFLPYVIYIGPVLNEYLYYLSAEVYKYLEKFNDVQISPFYRPMQWIPHTTIGKKLSKDEMQTAFRVLQNQFSMFHGKVVRIGLAKTSPYEELGAFELM